MRNDTFPVETHVLFIRNRYIRESLSDTSRPTLTWLVGRWSVGLVGARVARAEHSRRGSIFSRCSARKRRDPTDAAKSAADSQQRHGDGDDGRVARRRFNEWLFK